MNYNNRIKRSEKDVRPIVERVAAGAQTPLRSPALFSLSAALHQCGCTDVFYAHKFGCRSARAPRRGTFVTVVFARNSRGATPDITIRSGVVSIFYILVVDNSI